MKSNSTTATILPLLTAGLLTACGGGGGGDSGGGTAPVAASNVSPGGIWNGTDSVTGLSVLGVIDEQGDLSFIRADGAQFVGSVYTSTTEEIDASFDGYAPAGYMFPNGSPHGKGSLKGTVVQRQSMSLTTTFTPDGGQPTTGSLTLTYDSLYGTASSLQNVAGMYIGADVTGGTVAIDASGHISGGAASIPSGISACNLTGTISIIDPSYDVYRVSVQIGTCGGQYRSLQGQSFSGLAVLRTDLSPMQFIVSISGGGVLDLTRAY